MKDLVAVLRRPNARVVVLAGAGISVSAGVPDFRSKDGIYNTIAPSLGLSQPEELFDIHYFRFDPKPFYIFAKSLFPGGLEPTFTHRFFRRLEGKGKLRRMYTQNIDGLEKQAGIRRVVHCHGSFERSSCLDCKRQRPSAELREDVMRGTIPTCSVCGGLMKPNVTFFGEKLASKVSTFLQQDKGHVDLLVVVGTSLKVAPISSILDWFDSDVPRVLCNRQRLSATKEFDLELLGDADVVFRKLSGALSWNMNDEAPPSVVCRKVGSRIFRFFDSNASASTKETFRNTSVPAEPTTDLEESYRCDACGRTISPTEERRHCGSCFDFDLCGRCYLSGEADRHRVAFDPEHTFSIA